MIELDLQAATPGKSGPDSGQPDLNTETTGAEGIKESGNTGESRVLNDSELERSRELLAKLTKGEPWQSEDEQWFTNLFGRVEAAERQGLLAGVLKEETTDSGITPEAQTAASSEVKSEEIKPQEIELVESAEVAEGSHKVSVPTMITHKMKEELRLKGYSDEQINKLTPEAAHQILSQTEGAKEKEEEAPKVQTEETETAGSIKEAVLEQEKEERMELSVDSLWGEIDELWSLEQRFKKIEEENLQAGNDPSVELAEFQDRLPQVADELKDLGEEPTPQALAAVAAKITELKTLAREAENSLVGKVEIKPEDKKEKKLGILEKLEEFKKNHKVLSAFGTAAARVVGVVLGTKILQEGIGLAVGAVREKKKGSTGWGEATKKALAKSSTDLGRFLYGRVDVKERRTKLEGTIEGFFEAYRDQNPVEEDKWGERFIAKVKELDEAIKGATYLTPVERQAYRDRLAKTIWHYRRKGENSHGQLKQQVKQETEQYIHNKALKYTVARDTLNFGLTAVSAGLLRLPALVGFLGWQRGAQAAREYEHLEGVREKTDEEILKGNRKLRKIDYIVKDITINSTWETVNALAFRGARKRLLDVTEYKEGELRMSDIKSLDDIARVKKIKTHYGRRLGWRNTADFIGALGTVFTAFGITSLVRGGNIEQALSGLPDKISNSWSDRGLLMFSDGFIDNALHIWHSYTHPAETIAKIRQAILGGNEVISGGRGGVKLGDADADLGTARHKIKDSSAIEREFVRREHPEVYKGAQYTMLDDQPGKSVQEGAARELPAELKTQIDEAIKAGKLDAAAVEAYLAHRVSGAAKSPTMEDIQKFSELIRVDKGGSYWSTFLKQFRADPQAFGYEGDLTNKTAIDAYGKRIMADYAFREGLVFKNADGSLTDVRIKDPNARVIWQFDKDKGLDRVEYQPGKQAGRLETYKHTSVKEAAPKEVSAEKPSETQAVETQIVEPKSDAKPVAGPVTVEAGVGGGKSYYAEVDLQAQFRGAKSFDHKLHVYVGDLPDGDSEPDGLVDRLRFTDDSGNLLTDFELPRGRQRTVAELLPEIYRKTQAFDRTLTDLQELMPKSQGTLNLADQVKVAKLVVPNEALFEDGAIHEARDELVKLDKIFCTHKEYLSDDEFTAYLGKNVDDLETATVAKLYDKGWLLKSKLGFKSVDYDLLNEYISDKRPLEFSVGKKGLEYTYLDDEGRPYHTMLTEEKIVIEAVGTKRFDAAAIEKFRGLAEAQMAADQQEYDSLSEEVDDVDITRKILQLKCHEVTDTEIAELFPATDRSRAQAVFNYLVSRIGKGDESLLDLRANETVAQALSDIAHKR